MQKRRDVDKALTARGTGTRKEIELSVQTIRMAQVRLCRRELDAVEKVLKSGKLRAGPLVEDFERRFARTVRARFAIATSSGTASLEMAYRALLRQGDEVIVPDFTFVATASMVLAAGGRPVLADVSPETFTLDPESVEKQITPFTKALAPVHLFGHPADISRLSDIARGHGLKVIWDAAQAHGSRFEGQDVGSFGDVVCYSFYPSKNMTTGEGGMITTSDPALASDLKLLRSHGEEDRYRHVRLGFNFRMTDLAAAIGREQLAKLPAAVVRRQNNAAFLSRGLAGLPGIAVPRVVSGFSHAFNQYTILIDSSALGLSRDEFKKELAKHGIETAVHYPWPLHRQPIFRGYGTDEELPVSTRLAKTVLSLPVHPGLTREDLRFVVRTIRTLVGRSSRRT